jgi:RHS repeat-associated protein
LPPIDRNRRATINVTDLLGTTGAVVDLLSGDLVEVSTYYPNGARENLWTNDALVPIEPMGFTTKEADEEIGVTYFGERWLIPRLGRWATPDPLHIHASGGGETGNSYHYVSGNLLQAVDPLGLGVGDGTAERIVSGEAAQADPSGPAQLLGGIGMSLVVGAIGEVCEYCAGALFLFGIATQVRSEEDVASFAFPDDEADIGALLGGPLGARLMRFGVTRSTVTRLGIRDPAVLESVAQLGDAFGTRWVNSLLGRVQSVQEGLSSVFAAARDLIGRGVLRGEPARRAIASEASAAEHLAPGDLIGAVEERTGVAAYRDGRYFGRLPNHPQEVGDGLANLRILDGSLARAEQSALDIAARGGPRADASRAAAQDIASVRQQLQQVMSQVLEVTGMGSDRPPTVSPDVRAAGAGQAVPGDDDDD